MRGQGLPLNTIIIAIIVIVVLVVVILIFTGQSQSFVEATSQQCRLAGGECSASCSAGSSLGTLGCDSGVCCASGSFGAPTQPVSGASTATAGDPFFLTASAPNDARRVEAQLTTPSGQTRTVELLPATDSDPLTGRATATRTTYRGTYTDTDTPGEYAVDIVYLDRSGETVTIRSYVISVRAASTRLAFTTAYPQEGNVHDDVRISTAFGGEKPTAVRAVIENALEETFEVALRDPSPLSGRATLDEGGDGLDRFTTTWQPPGAGRYTITIHAETADETHIWTDTASFTRGSAADFAPELKEARDLVIRAGDVARPVILIQFPNHDARVFIDIGTESYELVQTAIHGGIFREFTGSIEGLSTGVYTPTVRVVHVSGAERFSQAFTIEVGESANPQARLGVRPAQSEPGDLIEFKATGFDEAESVIVHISGPEEHEVVLSKRDYSWQNALWTELRGGSYIASLEIDGNGNQATAPFTVAVHETELTSLVVDPLSVTQGSRVTVRATVRYAQEPVEAIVEGTDERVTLSSDSTWTPIPGEPVTYRGSITLDEPGSARIRIQSGSVMLGEGVLVEVYPEEFFDEPMVIGTPTIAFGFHIDPNSVPLAPIEGELTDVLYYSGEIRSARFIVTHDRTDYIEPAFFAEVTDEFTREEYYEITSFISIQGTGMHELTLELSTTTGDYTFERGSFTVVSEQTTCGDTDDCEGSCIYAWQRERYECSSLCAEQGARAADAESCCDGLSFDGEFCSQPASSDRFTLVFVPIGIPESSMGTYRNAAQETAERFSSMLFPMCASDVVDLIVLEETDCRDFCSQFPESYDQCIRDANACASHHVARYDLAMIIKPHIWGLGTIGFCPFHSKAGFVSLESDDLVGTTLHEMGHCLGLGHLSCGPGGPPGGFCGLSSNRLDCQLDELGLDASMEHTEQMIMSYCDSRSYGPTGLGYMQTIPRIKRIIDAC